MGEYAEMALDGIFCETCGEFLDADPAGFPQQCESCHKDELKEAIESGAESGNA